MVQLEEIVDEEFANNLKNAEDEAWDTDDASVSSDDDDYDDDIADETVLDRIYALRDAIPPARRKQLSHTYDRASTWAKWGAGFGGNTAWILLSSCLLLGAPFITALVGFEREKAEAGKEYAKDALLNPVDGEGKDTAAAL